MEKILKEVDAPDEKENVDEKKLIEFIKIYTNYKEFNEVLLQNFPANDICTCEREKK
jgi:hypothetical protein